MKIAHSAFRSCIAAELVKSAARIHKPRPIAWRKGILSCLPQIVPWSHLSGGNPGRGEMGNEYTQ
eukprot:1026127-Rhodomonas_salina.1